MSQNYDYKANEDEANDDTMNDPLIGVYSAWINLIVQRLRKIDIETVLVREPRRNLGTKEGDDKHFDGLIGLVQHDVSETLGQVLQIIYKCD